MKIEKIEGFLPIFPGFYNTVLEVGDGLIDGELEYHSEQTGRDLENDDLEINYEEYHDRIARACVEPIESEIIKIFGFDKSDFAIEFEKLNSPRQYNFTNDSINVVYQCSKEAFERIITYLFDDLKSFEYYLKSTYTSYDGFSSNYSNDYKTWLREYLYHDSEKIDHCFSAVLDYILKFNDFTDLELYYSLESNGEIYVNTEVIEQ